MLHSQAKQCTPSIDKKSPAFIAEGRADLFSRNSDYEEVEGEKFTRR